MGETSQHPSQLQPNPLHWAALHFITMHICYQEVLLIIAAIPGMMLVVGYFLLGLGKLLKGIAWLTEQL